MDTDTYNQCQLYIFNCMSPCVDFNACFFFRGTFQPVNVTLTFQIGLMIAHERFEGNLHLQLTWKVFSESGPRLFVPSQI